MYLLTRSASPQFGRPITVRVIRERTERHTYHGWTWLDVYVLNAKGDATERRELFVRPDGLRPTQPSDAPRRDPVRRNTTRADR
nr:hypothetical protein [Micromonospora qiuiae]